MIAANVIDERRGFTSASNAEADSRCSARHLAQQRVPEEKVERPDAATGRKVHEALARRDPSKLKVEDRDTYDRCLHIEAKKVHEFFGEEKVVAWSENPDDPAASRFWVRFGMSGRMYEHSCRPDRFYRSTDGKRMLIIEYKTLFGDIPVSPRNLQLRDQQCILRGHYLVTGDIGVVVAQPWADMNPPICVYTAEESDRARREMFDRVIASNNPNAVPVPGEVQCAFCRAKPFCLEYQKWAGQATPPAMLTVLEVPMALWTADQRARAAEALRPAEEFLENLKAFLKEGLAKDPDFIPGWTLDGGRKLESITDPQTCFDRFRGLGGKLEDFMGCITVGKSKLKEAVNKVTGAKGKALESAMGTLTEGIVSVKTSAPSLKRVEEK